MAKALCFPRFRDTIFLLPLSPTMVGNVYLFFGGIWCDFLAPNVSAQKVTMLLFRMERFHRQLKASLAAHLYINVGLKLSLLLFLESALLSRKIFIAQLPRWSMALPYFYWWILFTDFPFFLLQISSLTLLAWETVLLFGDQHLHITRRLTSSSRKTFLFARFRSS